jgi:hypothetical protein
VLCLSLNFARSSPTIIVLFLSVHNLAGEA